MDISPRSGSRRASEPVDDWLRNEGYFRKNSAHDATCLFRAVSEQIYLTQYYHLKVREQCVDFMRKNKEFFEKKVKIPFDNYLDQISCVTEWGSNVEIQAVAQLYKRDIVIFNATKLERYMATDNGFEKYIYLCQMGHKVYESVFKREILTTAAFCQSIMYQTLYKGVFKMPSIDTVVQTMLHERTSSIRHEKFFLKTNMEHRDNLTTELLTKIDTETSSKPKTDRAPFPYRIAKALDPNIYRNIDYDIWQEMRKEVRWSGWTRWNDSELQIGAKCLVQLEDTLTHEKSINKTTKSLQKPSSAPLNQDQNGNLQENPSKKVPALLIGHIQEMSKNEGPVVVFIEELGEKRSVPFTSLKPLLASRKPHLPLGVISPRKNSSHDVQKYRPKYSHPRKPKDSSHTSLDSLNNNEHHDKPIKNPSTTPSDPPPPQNPTILLKPFTSVDNYQSNMNTIEVRPVSIILDNPQPLMTPGNDSRMEKEEGNTPKPSVSPMNNNNLMINNNNLSQLDAYEKSQGQIQVQGQIQPQGQPQGHVNEVTNAPPGFLHPLNHPATHQEPQGTFYPQMYPQTPNIMCVPPEGMYPVQYYQQQEVPQAPPVIQDRSLRPINISAGISTDLNGADLPYSDPATLRFFYNLGIEAFRCGNMWPPGSMAYGPPCLPQGNVLPAVASAGAPEAPQGVQGAQRREEDRGYQGKRRPDERIERNFGRNSGTGDSRGGYRGNYPRREQGNFQRIEGNGNSGYEYKNKNYGVEEKEGRDGRDLRDQRDQRKNGNRFNSNNNNNNKKIDNRVRNFEKNNTFQGYQGHFRGDNGSFRRVQNEQVQGNIQASVQGASNVGNQQFQGNYQQQSGYNEQQTVYYSSEGQGFYPPPPNANFYPVGFMPPPQEGNEGGGYVGVCGTGENFQPPITTMYPQYVYPPGVYPGVSAGGEGNWYPLGGGQGFVPYQVPVSQPPPNMVRPPASS